MNDDSSGGGRGLGRAGVLVAAGIAVLVAACGGGGSSAGSGSAGFQKAEAYAQCMRTKGDPLFPDPRHPTFDDSMWFDPGAPRTPARVPFEGSVFQTANRACGKLDPPVVITPAQIQAGQRQDLRYAACMRSHGLASFPDPVDGGEFVGVSWNSPVVQSANKICGRLTGVAQP